MNLGFVNEHVESRSVGQTANPQRVPRSQSSLAVLWGNGRLLASARNLWRSGNKQRKRHKVPERCRNLHRFLAQFVEGTRILTNRPEWPLSSNRTMPETLAKRVSSFPMPTLSPGFNGVPRWRTSIDPPETNWPSNRLTPSRCAFESRPLREVPCPFLCAISRFPFPVGALNS
jgi:hypothetical protein